MQVEECFSCLIQGKQAERFIICQSASWLRDVEVDLCRNRVSWTRMAQHRFGSTTRCTGIMAPVGGFMHRKKLTCYSCDCDLLFRCFCAAQNLERKIQPHVMTALRGWLPERPGHLRIRSWTESSCNDSIENQELKWFQIIGRHIGTIDIKEATWMYSNVTWKSLEVQN